MIRNNYSNLNNSPRFKVLFKKSLNNTGISQDSNTYI